MCKRTVAAIRVILFLTVQASIVIAGTPNVEFHAESDRVAVSIGGTPVATYIYRDRQISRPYFAHVCTPNGIQVTRNHPPVDGTDVADHPTYHPGLWMAFGDISGADDWRLKVPVAHVEFVAKPAGGPGRGAFTVRNRYLSQQDPTKAVCEEVCRLTFLVRPAGFLILWDAEFSSDTEFVFGDQEEMGLGVRVATPIRVEAGNREDDPRIVSGNGTILDAAGRRNGAEVWGQSSAWCDYSGTLHGQHVGITLFCHPENFRASWFHARDYGLLLANPFGRAAFEKGEKSQVVVPPGATFRLRYGVFVHASKDGDLPDLDAVYEDYVQAR